METRRKRRLQSSPSNTARMELDFGPSTPSPKRRKVVASSVPAAELDADSFTIKSFYGKREKLHFPHSPGRRKAVDKVLDKISDENTDSKSEKGIQRRKSGPSRFDFHSSDSADTENECQKRPVLHVRQKKVAPHGSHSSGKVALEIVKVKKTPRNGCMIISRAKSTGKIPTTVDRLVEQERTPIMGRRFFKSRSPASADKGFGNMIIKKGFDLKFYPKRLNMSASKISRSDKKPKSRGASVKVNKSKYVKSVKASESKLFGPDAIFFLDDGVRPDEAEMSDVNVDSQLVSSSDIRKRVASTRGNNDEFGDQTKEKADSGVETANSCDLFSTPSEHANIGTIDASQVAADKTFDLESETVSLIGLGSEDLFSNSGRSTPVTGVSRESTPVPSTRGSPNESSERDSVVSGSETPNLKKLFPIFTTKSPPSSSQLSKLRAKVSPGSSPGGSSNNSPLLRYVRSRDKLEQMIIDAGQKRYGATQCDVCGMVYTMSEPADETMHYKFHQSLLNALKFQGWKKEHVVQEYVETGSRVIMITADSPKYASKKVEEINKIMGQELGFPEPTLNFRASYKAFLYVSENKKIEGCCVSEPVNEGYRVLPDIPASQSSQAHPGHRPWCCSDVPEPAVIGISRIWVYNLARKKGVATKLLDCVRQWAVYGCVIPKRKMAFSDPTPDGKILATNYIGTPTFLVYKYH